MPAKESVFKLEVLYRETRTAKDIVSCPTTPMNINPKLLSLSQ
jgi:hypothetical protein